MKNKTILKYFTVFLVGIQLLRYQGNSIWKGLLDIVGRKIMSLKYIYSNPPIYRSPIYRVPRYNVPLCIPPISCFTIEHVLTFPRFTLRPIYRACLLSPEKHGKSGDYCTYIFQYNSSGNNAWQSFSPLPTVPYFHFLRNIRLYEFSFADIP